MRRTSVFTADAVPYFPIKLLRNGTGWVMRNPITDVESVLNEAAYNLIALCDGYRNIREITTELSQV